MSVATDPVLGRAPRYRSSEAVAVPATWMAEFRSAAMFLVEIPGTEDRAASSAGLVAISDASAAMAALLLSAC